MKRLFFASLLSLSLFTSAALAQTNTVNGNFFNTVEGYFSSFNASLDSTFGAEHGAVWTGVDSIQGGPVNLANSIGISYDAWRFVSTSNTNLYQTAIQVESVTRNSGIAGTLVSEQFGIGLNFIIHDVKLTGYLDAGYDIAGVGISTGDRMFAEVGLRVFKALTAHTFAGVGIGAQFPRNAQVASSYVGFNF